jgi:hypothetical protein
VHVWVSGVPGKGGGIGLEFLLTFARERSRIEPERLRVVERMLKELVSGEGEDVRELDVANIDANGVEEDNAADSAGIAGRPSRRLSSRR